VASRAASADPLPVLLAERERFSAFLARRVKDRATADDLLQSAFTKVLARRAAPRDPARVVAWFFRILRHSLIDEARRAGARRRTLEGATRSLASDDTELHQRICECVAALARTLPPEHRDILQRIEVEGESVREAASKLGLTPNNAAVRAHRARAALLRRVRDLCGACAEHRCLRCRCEPPVGPGKSAL
jgi:RNA polymerase sigma-70 factor (ECF subfamily)